MSGRRRMDYLASSLAAIALNSRRQIGGSYLRFVPRRRLLVLTLFYAAIALPTVAQQPSSDQVTIGIIVVSSREQAQQVLNRLQLGDDFSTLAKKQYSAEQLGDLVQTVLNETPEREARRQP